MEKFLVCHSSAIDANSVGSHDAGTNLDFACFNVKDIKCITAGNASLEITMNETGMFNAGYNGGADNEALEQSLVILTVTDGSEHLVAKKLIKEIATGRKPAVMLDSVNSDYAVTGISAVAVRRTTTSRAVSAA